MTATATETPVLVSGSQVAVIYVYKTRKGAENQAADMRSLCPFHAWEVVQVTRRCFAVVREYVESDQGRYEPFTLG